MQRGAQAGVGFREGGKITGGARVETARLEEPSLAPARVADVVGHDALDLFRSQRSTVRAAAASGDGIARFVPGGRHLFAPPEQLDVPPASFVSPLPVH